MLAVNTLNSSAAHLYKWALRLAIFTMLYNLIEGLVSTFFGAEDGSLALFGFGVDSFIEVLSGFGIAHMILRTQKNKGTKIDEFEKAALRITGFSFYTLVGGLIITSAYNIYTNHNPHTTIVGVIVSVISIVVMLILMYNKQKVGHALHSDAILADAGCTRVCIYMSVILLVSSGIYEFAHIPYIDSVGTLGLSFFAYKEGKECFEKARTNNISCCK